MPVRYGFLPAVFLITAVVPARADPVTLVSATRFVRATATAPCCGTTSVQQNDLDFMAVTAVTIEPNPSAVGQALQSSKILDAERFFYGQASVSSQVTAPGGGASGESSYFLTLDLSQPQNYHFGSTFMTASLNDGDTTVWTASITDDNAPDTPILALSGGDSISRYFPGTLLPGRYDFLVSLSAVSALPGGLATGLEDFTLEFSDVPPAPTPEPASLLLLGSGLAALIARRARARTPSGPRP